MRLPLVNVASPVNWAAPLNRGLLSWWMNLPSGQWGRGTLMRDLCRQQDATLTNGAGWAGPIGRRGGYGSFLFDGTNDVSRFTYSRSGPTQMSVFASVYVNNFTDFNSTFCIGTGGDRMVYLDTRATTGLVHFSFTQGHNTHKGLSSTNAITTGQWYRIGGTYKSGEHSVYINGVRDATTGSFTGNPDNAETFGSIGAIYEDTETSITNAFDGYMDDLRFYNRALSQDEALADYKNSLGSWEQELNWVRPWCYPGGTATANRRRRYIILAGAA